MARQKRRSKEERRTARQNLTPERVRELLDYNPDTGELRWKVSRGNRVPVGSVAGHVVNRSNYSRVYVSIDWVPYLAHRLIWFHVHGVWPDNEIDHIDGNANNNRLSNLRQADRYENCSNSKRKPGRVTGYYGVQAHGDKFGSYIVARGTRHFLGVFGTAEAAYEAYKKAAHEMHREFSKLNRI